ncbi:hypothetical protein QVH83_002400 [Salmonella enterica]|nr:hypothetical protein [Salmonella enterica]
MNKKCFEPNFFKLRGVFSKFNVDPEVVIDLWFNEKIRLYIKLEGISCTIVRYSYNSSYQAIKDMKKRILDGDEKYQYSKSPSVKIRYFKPSENANIISEIIRKNNDSVINDFECEVRGYNNAGVKFIYNGIAKGYWKVVPTKLTHFERERYVLSDMTAVSSEDDESGAIIVNDYDSLDYLFFSEKKEIDKMDLYVNINDILNNESRNNSCVIIAMGEHNPIGNTRLDVCDSNEHNLYIVPSINVALYLVIHELFPCHEDGRVIYSKIAEDLNFRNIKKTRSVVSGWIKKPVYKRSKPYKINEDRKNVLSIYLNEICNEKGINKEASTVFNYLCELLKKYDLDSRITFSEREINLWLNGN